MARLESGLEGILGLDFLTSSKSEISIKRLNCSERESATYCTRVKIKNGVFVPAKSELLLEGEMENEIGESFGLV